MGNKTFKWVWPDGTEVIATWCYTTELEQLRNVRCFAKEKQCHETHVMMDITQWGLWSHHWIAVHQCRHCKQRWACEGFETYELAEPKPF